jgi:hypothetical protein
VKKFAFEVMQALQHLRGKCKPVFLGRALSGHDELRSLCAIELQKRHFRVGPEALYVLDDEGALRRDLRQAALSVHFIGGADASALQAIEIAAEVCAGATILYQPFGSETTDEERIWLADFERSPELKAAGKYQRIEGKTEQELIAVLEQEITRIRPPASGSAEQAAVAVICDQPDLELARMLWREIQERDRLAVSYPAFLETRSTSMQRMRSWKDLVKTCQALLVCWGQTHDPTLLESICQLAASASPDAPHEWYLTGPELDQKLQKFPGAICQQPDQFNYDALTGFLNLVRRRSAAP